MLDYDLILASASPRRAEILTQIGVNFVVVPAAIDETRYPEESALKYVERMALEKVQAVVCKRSDSLPVLGSDTVVVLGSRIFGKPENADDARTMLSTLSDNCHQVFTSVAVGNGKKCSVLISKTEVKFRTISTRECLTYWRSGEPQDKAGAYAIQGYGSVFVESIKGSYSGVVGLPIAETAQLLRQFKIPVWQT